MSCDDFCEIVSANPPQREIDARDEFAMRAMTGIISNEEALQRFRNMSMSEGFEASTLMATAAYQIADAMLAERAK